MPVVVPNAAQLAEGLPARAQPARARLSGDAFEKARVVGRVLFVRLHDPFDDRALQAVVRPDGREHLLADAHGKPAYIPICSVGNVFILRKAERGV